MMVVVLRRVVLARSRQDNGYNVRLSRRRLSDRRIAAQYIQKKLMGNAKNSKADAHPTFCTATQQICARAHTHTYECMPAIRQPETLYYSKLRRRSEFASQGILPVQATEPQLR